jgi:hypothetical protein
MLNDFSGPKWMLHRYGAVSVGGSIRCMRCESFQTLAAEDAWGAGKGFSSGQSLTSVTLHRRDGEIGRHRVNVSPQARCERRIGGLRSESRAVS